LDNERGDSTNLRQQIPNEVKFFGFEFTEKNMHSGQIPTGAIDAGNKACFDRIIAGRKDDGYR